MANAGGQVFMALQSRVSAIALAQTKKPLTILTKKSVPRVTRVSYCSI